MTDLSVRKKLAAYKPAHKVRIVTAASLFDGDRALAALNKRAFEH